MTESYRTPPEVAKLLRVASAKIIGLIERGELRAVNMASPGCIRPRWRIAPDALEEFLARRANKPPAPRVHRRRTPANVTQYF